jgi:phosphoribosylformylglycinamidine (FGAM) synthase-like amidotransferase family enzyme
MTFTIVSSAVLKQKVEFLWHKDRLPAGLDCVVLPGGFSYGDYLRCGAMGTILAELWETSVEFAARGGLVLGICNGFQILCESGPFARRPRAQTPRSSSSASRFISVSRKRIRPLPRRRKKASFCGCR